MQLRSSWNRDDPRFLRQQPGNRDLRRCRFLLPRNIREHIHQGLVCLPVFLVETWNDVAKIGAIKLRALVDCAREEALPQRTEWHKADPEFIKSRQNLVLHLSPPKRIFALQGGDRLNGVGTTDRLNASPRTDRSALLYPAGSGPSRYRQRLRLALLDRRDAGRRDR